MRDVNTNTSRFFHYGAQGETRYLTNSSGTVTDSYYYEAYGTQIASSGSTYNPYKYGGKFGYYKDDGGESLLATWRWYSPSQMRWINRDPIKFAGGSNVYQYVEGNPVKFYDKSGKNPMAIKDLYDNKKDMNKSPSMRDDKYFHCKANCEATKRGYGGKQVAQIACTAREYRQYYWDYLTTDKPLAQSQKDFTEDEAANSHGRSVPKNKTCREWCDKYRADDIPSRY